MDVPTLIVVGAAGGLLRGAVDLYTRFVSWQAVRLACLQEAKQAPRFRAYFDPSTDIVAPVVHTVMGSGAAVLFGTTGQISGAYAALVVGMSAPMLLTQLTRVQTVNEAVAGGDRRSAETTDGAAGNGGAAATGTVGVDSAEAPGVAAAAVTPMPSPPVEPRPAPSADPVQPPVPDGRPLPSARPMSSPRPSAPVARVQEPGPGELPEDRAQLERPTRSGGTPLPADSPDGEGSGLDGRSAPRWRQGHAIREEGL